ncbi:paxillin isoform X2 [Exaiptasia diaphana]|uniref:LIM zinc-binding domain-containing protein n=1 Tax=Exaiptasia diaphana TaxID=2652724 RepID=A0A913Y2M8_EXADI|nr:paxillin isoform X2 [Exaiptasia diaphana]XP_020913717.1 paxillin isoform X2 [Exaiptasia diaphana]KXJ07159.1 Paxillin [Exaiptasia diaphana]
MDGIEDLDALLADLQATNTAAVNNSRNISHPVNGRSSPDSPPPPLPPPPSLDALEPVGPSSSHKDDFPPPPPPEIASTQSSSLAMNLSELDSLLEDLGKPQYPSSDSSVKTRKPDPSPVIMDTSQKPVINGQTSSNKRPSVDAMLDELDSIAQQTPKSISTSTMHQPVHHQPQYHNVPPVLDSHGRTASSATKELDDLMASLSDFKVNVGGASNTDGPSRGSGEYAKPQKSKQGGQTANVGKVSQLDSMLGTLQTDMSRQGVSTTKKGTCAACNKPIIGQVCTALGRTWHPEHFTCVACELPLGNKNFFERDGKPYCEKDYHDTFAPRCAYCNGPILDSCVTALDQTWHPEHFVCAECGQPFGDTGFHERDGKPFCREDYYAMFAPRCGGCGKPIMDNYISALSAHWHAECFVCFECRQPFPGGSFFDHDGRPYCEMHYHARRGTLCYSCQKPITGRCITAMHRKFHPEHFVCAFCLKQLNKGTFKEQHDKPYCHPCFIKLFG